MQSVSQSVISRSRPALTPPPAHSPVPLCDPCRPSCAPMCPVCVRGSRGGVFLPLMRKNLGMHGNLPYFCSARCLFTVFFGPGMEFELHLSAGDSISVTQSSVHLTTVM